METVSGINNWKLVIRRDAEGITILRAVTCDTKAALPEEEVEHCVVRICIAPELELELEEKLDQKALEENMPLLIQGCHLRKGEKRDLKEDFCAGCVLCTFENIGNAEACRHNHFNDGENCEKYHLKNNTNCVVISQGDNQEEIYNIIHKSVQEFMQEKQLDKKISVWCEGHLPLREITVGPCVNQKGVEEAIRHYCKHVYWLRDVEIGVSAIPYRNRL